MMRKNYACLALAALLAFGGAAPVYAVEQEGRDGWKAEFTGKEIDYSKTYHAGSDLRAGAGGHHPHTDCGKKQLEKGHGLVYEQ